MQSLAIFWLIMRPKMSRPVTLFYKLHVSGKKLLRRTLAFTQLAHINSLRFETDYSGKLRVGMRLRKGKGIIR